MGTGNVISTSRNASTGLCTTIYRALDYVLPMAGWVKAWMELAPHSVIMPSARISQKPSYKSNLC
jgi:hypothetical protein